MNEEQNGRLVDALERIADALAVLSAVAVSQGDLLPEEERALFRGLLRGVERSPDAIREAIKRLAQ